MIRYATIGTSWITRNFIWGCELTGEFEHTCVYSRDPERGRAFADEMGCQRVVCDLEVLAGDPGIDAVYIASPNALHYAQSKLMLAHKKHVICEKPAGINQEQVAALQAFARENGVVFMEALIARHLPTRQVLMDNIQKVGQIAQARIDYSQLSRRYDSYLAGNHENIFAPEMAAGTLMDLGIYCVYFAVDCFGVPDEITACATFLRTGVDGAIAAVFQYPDKLVTLTSTKTAAGNCGTEIQGDRGVLRLDLVSQLTGMERVDNDGRRTALAGNLTRKEQMSFEAHSFANYILRMQEYTQEYRDIHKLALEVHGCMDKIKRSAGIHFC